MADVRALVAVASRILAGAGHSDLIWGHASARDSAGGGAWIKQSGWGLDEVTPERVHLVDRDGHIAFGAGSPHLEYPIHTEIYAARPDVGGVVHAHGRYSIALPASGQDLLPVSHEGCLFTAPSIPRFTATADLIRNTELGKELATLLGDSHAAFMVNHGIVCTGPTVREAVVTAVLLERACQQQLLTMQFGRPANWSSDEEARAKRERIFSPSQMRSVWDYLARSIDADGSAA
jgi:L-ribulose-5-phosphate 4-epimerase